MPVHLLMYLNYFCMKITQYSHTKMFMGCILTKSHTKMFMGCMFMGCAQMFMGCILQ